MLVSDAGLIPGRVSFEAWTIPKELGESKTEDVAKPDFEQRFKLVRSEESIQKLMTNKAAAEHVNIEECKSNELQSDVNSVGITGHIREPVNWWHTRKDQSWQEDSNW